MTADEATAVQQQIRHALAALEADMETKRGLIRELTTALEHKTREVATLTLERDQARKGWEEMSALACEEKTHG